MVEPVAQSYRLQCFDGPLAAFLGAYLWVVHQWQLHILNTRGFGEQVVVLEDEANLPVAEHSTLSARHGAHGYPVEDIFAARWGVEAAQLVEQG